MKTETELKVGMKILYRRTNHNHVPEKEWNAVGTVTEIDGEFVRFIGELNEPWDTHLSRIDQIKIKRQE